MSFLSLKIACELCGCINDEQVKYISLQEYSGTILKSFWCKECNQPIVIRYKFEDETRAKVVERVESSKVYAPHKPEIGITIRPKQSRPRSG